jgi:hypothetical protein
MADPDPDLVRRLDTLLAADLSSQGSTTNSLPLGIRMRRFSTHWWRRVSPAIQSRAALGQTHRTRTAVSPTD